MDKEEFIKRLRKTPRKWRITRSGNIRFDTTRACPITALDGYKGASAVDGCAKRLGISESLKDMIVQAADEGGWHRKTVREALVKACGLTE